MTQNTKRASESTRRAKNKRRTIILAVEVLLILIMLAVLYFVLSADSKGPKISELNPENLGINQEVLDKKGQSSEDLSNLGVIPTKGYVNIALFGVDAIKEAQLYKNSNSDSIMIASINMDTGDIKLVSVYRDTFLNIGRDYYYKCNRAYQEGGAEQAIKMLNMNLDMDITKFITVNYQSLIHLVDGLGGIYIDVDKVELQHINSYQQTIKKDLKLSGYTPVTEAGYQKLNGLQATAYCRIRYKKGDDFARAASQREVIKAIEEKAKQTDVATLTKLFNEVVEEIYTNLDSKDLLQLVININNYRIVDEGGFPEETMRTTGNIGAKGSSVIPLNLESNVVWLHQFLFDDEDFTVSETVKECGKKISSETSGFLNR